MEKTPKGSALGSIELALQRSQNPATLDRLVFAARPSTGLAALVEVPKAVGKTDWRAFVFFFFFLLCSSFFDFLPLQFRKSTPNGR